MSDYISVHTGAVIDNAVTTVINGRAGIQGIISNGTEIEPNQNNKISINIPDISQSTGDSTTSTMSQNAITNQLREKANADLLNNYYQKTESYSKTEIDNIISEIPKFDIKVVLTLPTENISESTIYLVPTSQDEGGLYQEYVYINSRWELLGGQSVDLSDYYTKQVIDNLLNDKLDTGEVVQTTGYNTDKVMSQKAVTDIVNDKFDKSSIDNYYNKSETDNLLNDRININKIAQDVNGSNADYVVSQSAIKSALDGKIDKSWIKQTTGNDTAWIMSQKAVTDALDGKMDKIAHETGIWTPTSGVYTDDDHEGTNPIGHYDNRHGYYERIGNICFISFSLDFDLGSNSVGSVILGGLPYSAASGNPSQTLTVSRLYGVQWAGSTVTNRWTPTPSIGLEIYGGKNYAFFWEDNGRSRVSFPGNNYSISIRGSGVYEINPN